MQTTSSVMIDDLRTLLEKYKVTLPFDVSQLSANEITKWDATKQQFIGTGLYSARSGELEVAPNSIKIGGYSIAAAGEDVTFKKLESSIIFAPLWQEVKPANEDGYIRKTDASENVVVTAPGDDILVNPTSRFNSDQNQIIWGGEIILAEPCSDLVFECATLSGVVLWRESDVNLQSGPQQFTFELALELKAGTEYNIKIYSESDQARLKGTGDDFSFTINRSKFYDIPIASREWTTEQLANYRQDGLLVNGLSLDDRTLTVSFTDGSSHQLTIPETAPSGAPVDITPLQTEITDLQTKLATLGVDVDGIKQQYGQITHKVGTLDSVFSYRGNTAPTYPDEPRTAYFVSLSGFGPQRLTVRFPKPADGLRDGTIFMLVNENGGGSVRIDALSSSYTVNGGDAANIPPNNQFSLYAKNGNNWESIARGFIPGSIGDIAGQMRTQLAGQLHTQQEIDGMINAKLTDPDSLEELAQALDPDLVKLRFLKTDVQVPDSPAQRLGIEPATFDSQVETFTQWGGDEYPTTMSGHIRNDSGTVSLTRDTTGPMFVYIGILYSDATKVAGIARMGGLPTVWPSRDLTLSGKYFRVYRSPHKIFEQAAQFQVYVRTNHDE